MVVSEITGSKLVGQTLEFVHLECFVNFFNHRHSPFRLWKRIRVRFDASSRRSWEVRRTTRLRIVFGVMCTAISFGMKIFPCRRKTILLFTVKKSLSAHRCKTNEQPNKQTTIPLSVASSPSWIFPMLRTELEKITSPSLSSIFRSSPEVFYRFFPSIDEDKERTSTVLSDPLCSSQLMFGFAA